MKKSPSNARKNASCSLRHTDRHDSRECLLQNRERENGNSRNFRHDQPNGQRNFANGGHVNNAHAPASTTLVLTYNPASCDPSATTAATTSANWRSTSTTIGASLPPPDGIGFAFIAASSTSFNPKPINFSMTAHSGASRNFIDHQLLCGIEQKMINYVHQTPPVIINVAGNHRVFGVGKGMVIVVDHQGPSILCSFLSRSYLDFGATYFLGEQQQPKT